MSKFRYGALRDPAHAQSKGFIVGLGRGIIAPNKQLARSLPIEDQYSSSMCVGFALRRLIFIQTGLKVSHPCIYSVARALDRDDFNKPLVDVGCRPFYAIDGIHEFGVASEADWPFSLSNVDEEPDFLKIEQASRIKLSAFQRMDTADPVWAWQAAINAGQPVCFSTAVTDDVEDHDGRTPLSAPAGKVLGRHYLTAVGYETVNGRVYFHIANSWGLGWGDQGYGIVDDSFVEAADDAYRLTLSTVKRSVK